MKTISDDKIQMIWKCQSISETEVEHSGDEKGEVAISPTFYEENGTPMCMCGDDMKYLRTEIKVNKEDMLKELRVHAFDAQEVAKAISKEHLTHQASIISNLIAIVSEYHEQAQFVDGRNQAAVEASKKVAGLNTFIPYI